MPVEIYDDLTWDIGEIPIGSSTPDDFFELSYNATTNCPNCNEEIHGEAQYWSRDESDYYLERIDYDPCDCDEADENDDY